MAFAPTKRKKNPFAGAGGLQLTSMMDMMSIILLFLLQTYSTSGALLRPSPFVELPKAQRDTEPEKALTILVNTEIGILKGEGDVTPENLTADAVLTGVDELNDDTSMELPGLESYLIEKREHARSLPTGFDGKVTIQCDSAVTYDWLLKIINTCGQTEYATLDFVVIKES